MCGGTDGRREMGLGIRPGHVRAGSAPKGAHDGWRMGRKSHPRNKISGRASRLGQFPAEPRSLENRGLKLFRREPG